MLSSSALKYKIRSKPSYIAKVLALILLSLIAFLLYLLWGVDWFSAIFLIIYIFIVIHFIYLSKALSFSCCLSDSGDVEINSPSKVAGKISYRSFYNSWIIVLCVDVKDQLELLGVTKHNKPNKWFVVFFDSLEDKEFHLLARLIHSTR